MSDTVSPRFVAVVIETEIIHDILIYIAKEHLLFRDTQNRHGDKSYVGVRGFVAVYVRGRMYKGFLVQS